MSWVSALQFDTCLSVDIFAWGVKRSFAVNARVSRVGFSFAGGGGAINAFPEGYERDPHRLEFVGQRHQVPEVTSEPVETPADQDIESTPLGVPDQGVQGRSAVLGPAHRSRSLRRYRWPTALQRGRRSTGLDWASSTPIPTFSKRSASGIDPRGVRRPPSSVSRLGIRSSLTCQPRSRRRQSSKRQDFDGDGAVEPGITGLIDFSHSACTKRRENLVRPELRTSLKRHTPILDTQL